MAQTQAVGGVDLDLGFVLPKRRPGWQEAFIRLVREKPLGLAGLIIVLMLAGAAILAPVASPYAPHELGAGTRLEGPSLGNWFGTDNLGRDVFSRVMHGAKVSMWVGLLAVLTSTLIAVTIGVLSGYFGGWIDILSQRIVDAFIAFPGLIFLLAAVAVFRGSHAPGLPREGVFSTQVMVLVVAIGILLGVGSSRIIRSAVFSVKGQTYMEAARAIGVPNSRMIFVHVIPNIVAPLITLATLGFGTAILLEASLSFLGLGVPPNVPTWGGMLNREARGFMTEAPWLALAPGITLSLAIFGFNMLGDALRDILDPRMRGSGHGGF